MATIHEARVPHTVKNAPTQPIPIRCGPASIQAILYGLDNEHFDPPASASLKNSVRVRDDQEAIWVQVKEISVGVAERLHGESGISEEQQVCVPQADGRP